MSHLCYNYMSDSLLVGNCTLFGRGCDISCTDFLAKSHKESIPAMQLDSLDVSCPFLRAHRAAGVGEDVPVRKAAEIPIKETLELLVSKRLCLPHANVDPVAQSLERQFIGNCHTLFMLEPSLLPKLGLPIALEVR